MIDALREELAELSRQKGRLDKVDSMLRSLKAEETALRERERALKNALYKEEADVERLERVSAAHIIFTLLGKRDERLAREQQEAAAARLKYAAALEQLDDCLARDQALTRERRELAASPRRYEEVYDRLLALLRDAPEYARELAELERRLGEHAAQLKELDEAITAGDAVLGQIGVIEEHLGSAEGWGTWDLLGGGLISDLAKHSHLDNAQAAAQRLQVLLSRFRTELADVTVTARLGAVNVEGFLRFADYFFDGLIADWTVLNQIRDSRESVTQVRRQVSDAMRQLKSLQNQHKLAKSTLEQEIRTLAAHNAPNQA